MNERQSQTINYLREENRVLREQLGNRRLRFNDDQRRRLAVRAKVLGWKILPEVATIVTPDTLLAWHRKLIAQKYDGSKSVVGAGPALGPILKLWLFGWPKKTAIGAIGASRVPYLNLGHQIAGVPSRRFSNGTEWSRQRSAFGR